MFSPIKNTKVYEQVIDQIQNMIANGTLKKGDKLPSERDLVNQLGVSRTSIREALSALQMIGLVESRQGEGNFIKESFEESLFQPLSVMFMLNESNSNEILELRRIVEVETAALAAKRITEEELLELEEIVQKLKDTTDEQQKVKIDKEFHYKIAKASKNFLIMNMLNAVSSIMDAFIKDARRNILMEKSNVEILVKQHEDIYEALLHKKPSEAALYMRKHLEFANKYMEDDK